MKKKILSIALACGLTLGTVACSTSWLSTFDGYLSIAGPILIQILEIVSLANGHAVSPTLVAKINADQTALNQVAASVQTANSTDIKGACQAFNLGVNTFVGDLSAVEQLTNVTNPNTQNEINAAVAIAKETFQEIETPIASCAAASSQMEAEFVLKAGASNVKSANQVLKAFNATVDAKHQVHFHDKFVRYASFGHLQ